jgi:hypothetical protein
MARKQRSTLGLALGDLLLDRMSGGVAAYAAYVGCHRGSLSRAVCDPHRRITGLIECACALLWHLREEGLSPRDLLERPFPVDRMLDFGELGDTNVERAFTALFPDGYEDVLTDRLRLSKGGLRRSAAMTTTRAYPHLMIIAHLLIILRDQGVEPLDALRYRLPSDLDPRRPRDFGVSDGRQSLAL